MSRWRESLGGSSLEQTLSSAVSQHELFVHFFVSRRTWPVLLLQPGVQRASPTLKYMSMGGKLSACGFSHCKTIRKFLKMISE